MPLETFSAGAFGQGDALLFAPGSEESYSNYNLIAALDSLAFQ